MSESKTPRSDAAKLTYFWNDVTHEFVPYDVACQLESELNASRAREDKLAESLECVGTAACDCQAIATKALEAWRAAK